MALIPENGMCVVRLHGREPRTSEVRGDSRLLLLLRRCKHEARDVSAVGGLDRHGSNTLTAERPARQVERTEGIVHVAIPTTDEVIMNWKTPSRAYYTGL